VWSRRASNGAAVARPGAVGGASSRAGAPLHIGRPDRPHGELLDTAAYLDLAEGRELIDRAAQALACRIGDQEHGAAVLGQALEARGGVGDVSVGRVLEGLVGADLAGPP